MIDGRVFRFFRIDRSHAVGACSPELAFMVCQKPGVGNGKPAQGDGRTRLNGMKEGGVVLKRVELSTGFDVASDAQHPFP